MTAKRLILLIVFVIPASLASGYLHGKFTGRWGQSADLVAAGQHLATFPSEIGDWRLSGSEDMTAVALEVLRCTGYVVREYTNAETHERIDMFLIAGPAGPTAVHTPDICYSSQDYAVSSKERRIEIGDKGDSFWHMEVTPRSAVEEPLAVYYGWSTGNEWAASSNPRFEFGTRDLLYKIQVVSTIPFGASSDYTSASQRFINALLNSEFKLLP